MLRLVDKFLDKITMYRVVLYVLLVYVFIALCLSAVGLLPFAFSSLLFSSFLILTICVIANHIFAWAFKVPANVESVYITALILILLITPPTSVNDSVFLSFAIWASVLAVASKFILAIRKKHIFNPAAVSVVITAFFLHLYAAWWVGTTVMAPALIIGGFLIVRKIRRFDLFLSFAFFASLVTCLHFAKDISSAAHFLWVLLVSSPLIFFGTVMLTEPLTTPPTRFLRIIYGSFVGLLFSPIIHLGSIYSTPELALVLGNILVYLVSPKERLVLKLKEARKIANDTYDFIFKSNRKIDFIPGQYMEYTITDKAADSRGNRRYFTIASSPTEEEFILGIKFYPNPSSFKKQLSNLSPGEIVIASQRSGEFTLPKDKDKKLVFVAGGIGITPFRSMIKYLIDKNEKRDIILIYSNRTVEDIAYKEVFDQAVRQLGIKVVYTLSEREHVSSVWQGKTGFIDAQMIRDIVPDINERTFYVSGPHSLVVAFEDVLEKLKVKKTKIKKDYFPGFA